MRSFSRRQSRLSGSTFKRKTGTAALAGSLLFTTAAATPALHAQAVSVNGGSIQGTITDASGGVLPNATVVITGTDTGYTKTLTTDSAGYYSLGPLNPGNYTVDVTINGFQKLDVKTVVRTGTATSGNFKLTVGSEAQTIDVNAGQLQINTDQPGVSDVITREQIEALPINGRNFLDIAQLQPGVILQSGSTFDPTKAGYSAISVGGVSGRTTRILLDGQDITDETVGTTIMNVTEGAVDEFQLNRSTQDVSGEVTSTGQVLVATRSGTNAVHGEAFYNFQNNNAGFARTTGGFNAPFERNQFGGSIGGPIIKDKLFFFGNSERIKQDQQSAATTSPTFAAIQAQYPSIPSPYRETYSTIRLDYNAPKGVHLFVRGAYDVNSTFSNFQQLYSLYQSRNNVPAIVGGADFVTGRFTHSFRGGYEKFHNLLTDGTGGQTSIYNPSAQLGAGITLYDTADNFFAGPNYLAPQGTYQSDKQLRYDGTWTKGAHTLKFGASMNRLLGGGFASFYGPVLFASFNTTAAKLVAHCGGDPTQGPCPDDPLRGYSVGHFTLGNGNGLFTEKPGFGLTGGGLEDWRSGAYVADSWKISPSFTAVAGLRWSVDTDRANQDVPTPLCSSLDPTLQFPGCTGNTSLFDQYQAGFGSKTHQPYGNFGPQAGFVFSPGDHKTSVRGGVGIFYESDVFNNTSNARSSVVNANGNYFNDARICGGTNQLTLPNGSVINQVGGTSISTICSEPISQSAPLINQIKSQYVTASSTGGPNPGYIGSPNGGLYANGIYGAPYLTPYSIQFNGGIQHQLAKGTIVTVDYVHNATLKLPLVIDVNHVGAARYLNTAAAQAAITATLQQCGAASIQAAEQPGGCPANAATKFGGGSGPNGAASIIDFAANGLDSITQYTGGPSAASQGLAPAAFGGVNPNVGAGRFILPVGRSGYDALQIVFRQQVAHPAPGLLNANFQASYSLSRTVNPINAQNSGDQFFNASPWNNDNPNLYLGRSNLDHTNELSFGGSVSVKYGLNVGAIGHFYSAPATSLTLDNSTGNPGEIFRTDVDGDGTTGDLIPGTNPGAYMHAVKGTGLNRLINSYNATSSGRPTPAGQALVNAGLLTNTDLVALGAVQQPIALAPTTPIQNPAFRAFDLSAGYPIRLNRFREGLSLLPQVVMYNVANVSNFTGGANGSGLTGQLLNVADAGGTVGSVNNFLNGPNNTNVQNQLRTQRGSGTFDQGAPRSTEFQLRLNF